MEGLQIQKGWSFALQRWALLRMGRCRQLLAQVDLLALKERLERGVGGKEEIFSCRFRLEVGFKGSFKGAPLVF